jgi:hypothetical protein
MVATAAGVAASVALVAMATSPAPAVSAISARAATATQSPLSVDTPLTSARSLPATRAVVPRAARAEATRTAAKPRSSRQAMASRAAACAGLQGTVDAFLQHVYAAHLEASPGQQVDDITDVDQYVKTHTVMVEHMLDPLLGGSGSAVDSFLQHVYAAHLEASPGQQVADLTDVDQYVKTHTVMAEQMVAPLVGDPGSC